MVTSLPYCFKGEANFLSAFYEEVDSDKEVNSFEVNLAFNILSYLQLAHVGQVRIHVHEKSKIPFSYMLYAYSVKRAYRGTKPKESFR